MDVDMNIYVGRRFNVRIRSKQSINTKEALEQQAASFDVSDPRVKSAGPTHESEEINSRVVTTRPHSTREVSNLLTPPDPTHEIFL